jgi:hypothetical protein
MQIRDCTAADKDGLDESASFYQDLRSWASTGLILVRISDAVTAANATRNAVTMSWIMAVRSNSIAI